MVAAVVHRRTMGGHSVTGKAAAGEPQRLSRRCPLPKATTVADFRSGSMARVWRNPVRNAVCVRRTRVST